MPVLDSLQPWCPEPEGAQEILFERRTHQAASCLGSRPWDFRALFPLWLPGICSTWTSAAMLRWPAVSQVAKPTLGSSGSKGRFLSSSNGSLPPSSSRSTPRVFTLLSSHLRGMRSSGPLCADWSSGRVESGSLASPLPLLPQMLGAQSVLWNQRSPQRRDGGGGRWSSGPTQIPSWPRSPAQGSTAKSALQPPSLEDFPRLLGAALPITHPSLPTSNQ